MALYSEKDCQKGRICVCRLCQAPHQCASGKMAGAKVGQMFGEARERLQPKQSMPRVEEWRAVRVRESMSAFGCRRKAELLTRAKMVMINEDSDPEGYKREL